MYIVELFCIQAEYNMFYNIELKNNWCMEKSVMVTNVGVATYDFPTLRVL